MIERDNTKNVTFKISLSRLTTGYKLKHIAMFITHGINIIMTFTSSIFNAVDLPYLDSTSMDSTNHVSKIFEKKVMLLLICTM